MGSARTIALLAVLCTSLAAVPQSDLASPRAGEVSATRIRADVTFLASDLMEGRQAGSRGYELAALYAASQLQAAGWEPAGDNGTYLQQVPLLESTPVSASLSVRPSAGGAPVALPVPDDALVAPGPERVELTAPIVFAGYGVVAPEQKHDDYAGVDATGKIVAMLSNAPSSFPSEPRAHYASFDRKIRAAADRGAVGIAIILTKGDLARTPWRDYIGFIHAPWHAWTRPDGSRGNGDPRIKSVMFVNPSGAERLFAGAARTFEDVSASVAKGTHVALALETTLTVNSVAKHRRQTSPNVVARLPGRDPALAGTSVFITAHLDHVGMLPSGDGDRINNGAYDNAVGSAIVLDVARALASAPRPRRSTVIALVTAEESGLIGSDYLAQHLPAAAGRPVANVNLDMPLFLTPSRDLVAFGSENSTLEDIVRGVAGELDYTLSPDPMPEQNLFVRSDQYSFVKQGIPAVFLMPGLNAREAGVNGQQLFGEFLAQHYHKPSDDLSRPMDPGALERFARANLRLVQRIADAAQPPAWKPGNFFGRTFGK
jgi:hypothetical protein